MKKVDKEELYRLLVKMYGYTYDQIANMNKFQQLSLLKVESKVHFSNYDEYIKWKTAHG